MATIIIYNRNLVVTKISQGTDTHIVTVVEVQLNRKSFYIINQYCQFSDPIEDHMSKLSNMSLITQQSNVVYCANVNCEVELVVLLSHEPEGRNCRGNTMEPRTPCGK